MSRKACIKNLRNSTHVRDDPGVDPLMGNGNIHEREAYHRTNPAPTQSRFKAACCSKGLMRCSNSSPKPCFSSRLSKLEFQRVLQTPGPKGLGLWISGSRRVGNTSCLFLDPFAQNGKTRPQTFIAKNWVMMNLGLGLVQVGGFGWSFRIEG